MLRGAGRVWHDLRVEDLDRSGKEFDLMPRAMGFAALALLTVIPLLLVVAAVSPFPPRGLAAWVVCGMGLTGSSADAVTQIFSAPARVLGTTSVFSAVLLGVFGISFAGSVQAGLERIWGCPAGPWHKIWRQAVWLVAVLAYLFTEAAVGRVTNGGAGRDGGGGAGRPGLFWWGLRFLIGGRVSYLAALPGAVVTLRGVQLARTCGSRFRCVSSSASTTDRRGNSSSRATIWATT